MQSTLCRTWAEISLDAVAHNYRTLKARIGEDVKFLGVVKADSYGSGSIPVSRLLQAEGADYLAVSSIDEAIELRTHDITMPILILGHTPKEEVKNLIQYDITQAVSCIQDAHDYSKEAVEAEGILKVHIKADTGMSRIGFLCNDEHLDASVDEIVEAMKLSGLFIEGIFTHLAVSDEPGDFCKEYTNHQIANFKEAIEKAEALSGKKFAIRHCANTGGVARYPETWLDFDMVRPGLLLYGYGEFAEELGLKPVMALKTTVYGIKEYPADTRISYGGIFTTERPTRMGILPYGYADGFFRCLSNRVELYTKAGMVKQRGKICMDMCMVDLTDVPEIGEGDVVEIFGDNQSINDIAALAGTIPYEIACAVSKRVPRVYLYDGKVVGKELMLRG